MFEAWGFFPLSAAGTVGRGGRSDSLPGGFEMNHRVSRMGADYGEHALLLSVTIRAIRRSMASFESPFRDAPASLPAKYVSPKR